MKFLLKALTASAIATACATAASATTITPGTTVAASTVAYSSSNLVTSTSANFSTPTYSGSFVEYVYRDSLNSLCGSVGNCLTFVIQVSNNAASNDAIEHVTTGQFATSGGANTYALNVGYGAVTGDIAPLNISETAFGTIGFNFTDSVQNPVNPGRTSDFLVIQTGATNFTTGGVSVQDTYTANLTGYIPAAAVTPEPSSLLLLGTGLVGAGSALRRRRRGIA